MVTTKEGFGRALPANPSFGMKTTKNLGAFLHEVALKDSRHKTMDKMEGNLE